MPKNKIINRPFPWLVDEATNVPGYREGRIMDDDGYTVAFVPADQIESLVAEMNAMSDNKAAQQVMMERGFTLD